MKPMTKKDKGTARPDCYLCVLPNADFQNEGTGDWFHDVCPEPEHDL